MADYIYMMESRLAPEQQRGVNLVQEVARSHEMNIYLVGGTVRDILSGSMIHDLDFAVQGNALKLQKDLEKAGAIVDGVDEQFRTLYLLLPGNLRGEITTAREEKYDKPGKAPEMTPSTISEDLRRRDFTVNAMALSLNPGSRGLLLDPFNGVADIESKLVRVLHNYAFLEEPTRLIRATRFMARYDWTMEDRTLARYNSAKENNYIQYVIKRNVGHEIEQMAHENDPLKVMKALEKEDWMKVLHPHWSSSKVDVSGLNHLLKARQQLQDANYTVDAGPAVMTFLTAKLNSTDVAALQSAIPRKPFVHAWKRVTEDAKEFNKRLTGKEANTASDTWKLLTSEKPERLMYALATGSNAQITRKINDFLGKWRQIRARFPLPEMTEMRITPELPEYAKLVEDVFFQQIDGKLRTPEEIKKYLAPFSPPEPAPPPPPPRRGRAAKKVAVKKQAKPTQEGMAMANIEEAAVAVGSALGKAAKAVKSALNAVTPSEATAKAAKGAAAPAKKAAPAKAAASAKAAAPAKVAATSAPAKKSAAKSKPANSKKAAHKPAKKKTAHKR